MIDRRIIHWVLFFIGFHTALFFFALAVSPAIPSMMPGLLRIDLPMVWLLQALGLKIDYSYHYLLLGTFFHGFLGWILGALHVRYLNWYWDWWRRDRDPLICNTCGYDLRGQTVERCPECFTPFVGEQS